MRNGVLKSKWHGRPARERLSLKAAVVFGVENQASLPIFFQKHAIR